MNKRIKKTHVFTELEVPRHTLHIHPSGVNVRFPSDVEEKEFRRLIQGGNQELAKALWVEVGCPIRVVFRLPDKTCILMEPRERFVFTTLDDYKPLAKERTCGYCGEPSVTQFCGPTCRSKFYGDRRAKQQMAAHAELINVLGV